MRKTEFYENLHFLMNEEVIFYPIDIRIFVVTKRKTFDNIQLTESCSKKLIQSGINVLDFD